MVSESSYFMSPEKMVSRQCLACAGGDVGSAQGFPSLLESDALPVQSHICWVLQQSRVLSRRPAPMGDLEVCFDLGAAAAG